MSRLPGRRSTAPGSPRSCCARTPSGWCCAPTTRWPAGMWCTCAISPDRQWFQLPEGTDPIWRAYWNGTKPGGKLRDGPVVRTISECLQGTLWNGTVGMMPMGHALPEGLTCVRLGHARQPPGPRVEQRQHRPPDPVVHAHRGRELPPGGQRDVSLSGTGRHRLRYPPGIGSAQQVLDSRSAPRWSGRQRPRKEAPEDE